ncbi:Uncharacterised protein [BD1-7 clade bacterium]|uniref:Major facilitator superfamily (MFS) profile domain-containing protein n=1 Tax=BD1-7 clade bacterium TaxID=2029982 RepID=A0A5S9QAB9_9GAMM|nr:Uncharacterised protein [BD1-7 clade bacterium]
MTDQSMKPFTVLLIGQAISLFGSSLTGFALGIWAYEQIGSVTVYTVIALANIVPVVLLSPLAGAVADRYNRKMIVILSQIAAIAITGALASLYWWQLLVPWHIIALVTLNSVFNAFVLPTISATIPLMVSKSNLTKANGMIALAFGLIELATPAIAGTLYANGGMQTLFLVDLATFSVGIGAVIITRIPQPQAKTAAASATDTQELSLLASIGEGYRYLMKAPALLGLVGFFSSIAAMLIAAGVMVQPMLLGFAKPDQMGQIMSFAGSGIIAGAAIMIALTNINRHMPIVIGVSGLVGVGLLLLPATTTPWMIAAGGFIVMACFPVIDSNNRSIYQRKVDPAILGRVIGLRNFVLGLAQCFMLLIIGPLADAVFEPAMAADGWLAPTLGPYYGTGQGRGIAVLISLLGALMLVSVALTLCSRRMRRLDSELDDVEIAVEETEPEQQTAMDAVAMAK